MRTGRRSSRGAAGSDLSQAARATRTASTSARPVRRRLSRSHSRSRAPSAARATSRHGERAGQARSSTAARVIRSATSRRRASRSARSTTPMTARSHAIARRVASASSAARRSSCRIQYVVGAKAPRRRAESRGAGEAATQGRWRQAANDAEAINVQQRATPGAPGARVTGAEALDAFLGRLAARDSSGTTRRAYRTAISQYLECLDGRHADWRIAGAAAGARATSAELTERPPVAGARSAAALAALRSFYRYARREGLVEWRSVVCSPDAAPAAPPAAGPGRERG